MRGRRKKWKISRKTKCFLAALGLLAGVMLLDSSIRPTIELLASHEARVFAVQAINDAVYEELAEGGSSYGELVTLEYNDQGNVAALQTNVVEMNRLQATLTREIIDQVMEFRTQSVLVPLGSIIGGQLFSGRGPELEFRLIPAGFIETSIRNHFESAGINQTRHQILLHVRLTISAVLPGYAVSSDVETDVVLGETVIVGLVPDAYTMVGDGTDPLVGMIQDYDAAEQRMELGQ